MTSYIRTLMAATVLALPLLSQLVQAEEDNLIANLQQRLSELLQLNRETMERIGPAASDLQLCLLDQQETLAEEFSLANLLQAQRACTPLIEEMVSQLGFSSEEEKDEATSQLYKALIKESI